MPTYIFEDQNTGEQFEKFMSISSREQYLKDNPHLKTLITSAPGLSDAARLGRLKPDQGFRDLLSSMKNNKSYTGNKNYDWK